MGGNPKISSRATAVNHLFMALEKQSKKIKSVGFAGLCCLTRRWHTNGI